MTNYENFKELTRDIIYDYSDIFKARLDLKNKVLHISSSRLDTLVRLGVKKEYISNTYSEVGGEVTYLNDAQIKKKLKAHGIIDIADYEIDGDEIYELARYWSENSEEIKFKSIDTCDIDATITELKKLYELLDRLLKIY